FDTMDGTAVDGKDYIGVSGTLTFAPGMVTQSITVMVNGDSDMEPDKTFFVNLSNPENATIGKGQGVCTIVNDDGGVTLPGLSIKDARVMEGNSGTTNAVFLVVLSRPSQQPVTVDFATMDGSAVEGRDYVADSGTLTFAPGMTVQNIT